MDVRGGSVEGKAIVFRVGAGRYALPLEWIFAVQSDPGGDQGGGREGRFRYRGEELPLFSVATWFGKGEEDRPTNSLLIVGRDQGLAAARVDDPGKVVRVGEIQDFPGMCRDMVKGVFSGIMIEDGGLVLMIDPEGLMGEVGREADRESQGGEGR
jgi:chemotaxis signal transduction protein